MNKVIAEITTEQNSVVHGDHHIITTVELKDGVGPFDAGTLLFKGESGYEPLTKEDETNKPTAVAYDNLESSFKCCCSWCCLGRKTFVRRRKSCVRRCKRRFA